VNNAHQRVDIDVPVVDMMIDLEREVVTVRKSKGCRACEHENQNAAVCDLTKMEFNGNIKVGSD